MDGADLHPVGWVRSPVADRADAVRQGDEGAPDVVIDLVPAVAAAAADLRAGDELLLLTWLHLADRTTLAVHPRGDVTRPSTGVFATRSPDRPNPIGLHRVRVLDVDGLHVHVSGCEAVDGTPVVDIKPVLGSVEDR
ncbi:tRNA (N6-threonylcarbamoyladenosine(37)-N6)-methyltransferase TrmO [Cellulomonas fengjieae]|uniref:tRNA (N6-threonylcarbamoyladenosine(37)-N6)-methyltransferase TrmO n=1 Tax=Cellulomonas fengjieae TaxID=2819978 RepID=A0ABS3SBI9_9CELL|nr:tRNA (N6-threonylcarbamoyladenosine(37)-N6)-methyltransferase TrmO [Cellulomonas fengjieae]MBO3083109.1 tRNA (N6-threonylcarbamoyladenosine(37)-N6)-methyltransferase TrmO [Cellulomonas fengjieae]QVI65526.1 tRNA (N6-threonylcarbamoyladenosine(37)-N6)-methyltransferase TrmO [Cellulomonas fengjieae]